MSDDLVYKILMKKYPSMKGEEAVEHVRNYKKIIGGMKKANKRSFSDSDEEYLKKRDSIFRSEQDIKNAKNLEELNDIKKFINVKYHPDINVKTTPNGKRLALLNGIIADKEKQLKNNYVFEQPLPKKSRRTNVDTKSSDSEDIYQGKEKKPYNYDDYKKEQEEHDDLNEKFSNFMRNKDEKEDKRKKQEYEDRIAELKRKLKEDRAREQKEREDAEYDSDIEAHARKYVFPKRLDDSDDENRIFEFDEDLQKKEKQQGNGIKELKEQLKKEILEELADKKVEVVKVDNKPKKLTKWMEHVKKYRSKHPGISYKNALSEAKKTYVK